MAHIGRPSILERRQAVTDVQNVQGAERRLFRRAFRDASRLARRSKDPRRSQQAINILQQGQARGITAVGLSRFEENQAFAGRTLSQFQQDQAQARRQPPSASGTQPAAAGTGAQTNGLGGPIGGADFAGVTLGDSAVAPTPQPSSVLGARGDIPAEFAGIAPIGVTTADVRLPPSPFGEEELEGGPAVDPAAGRRLQEGLDLITEIDGGDRTFDDLTEEERAKLAEARRFQLAREERAEFGLEEAASRAVARAEADPFEAASRRARLDVR